MRYAHVEGSGRMLGEDRRGNPRRDRPAVGTTSALYGADKRFHIHGVTGPDEYTTVVNDNTYTNLMARLNLKSAAATVRRSARGAAAGLPARSCTRSGFSPGEVESWEQAAAAMHVPFDDERAHSPAGRDRSRSARCGIWTPRRARSSRCCCTTTRW